MTWMLLLHMNRKQPVYISQRTIKMKLFLSEITVFSLRRPRRLFQTWPGGPSVYLTLQFIRAWFSLSNGFYSLFLTKMHLANIPTAYHTLNKYPSREAYFQLHLVDPVFIQYPRFKRENTVPQ